MKTIVLAEKPSVGKELARILNCKEVKQGYINGKDYIVTWALGHLVSLAMPEEYSKDYENWDSSNLPIIPEKFKTSVLKETSKQYSIVKSLLRQSDIKELIIATDAGREGELVARWIIKQVGFNKRVKRLWVSSLTDKALREGFKNLKDSSFYDNLYHSATSRAKADWLIGLNVTRALTCKYNAKLSAGRVQTPTLKMIVEKEEEIKRFKVTEYYQIFINANNVKFGLKNNYFGDINKAKSILDNLKDVAIIKNIQTKQKQTPPPLLYDLTELQRDANKIYGFSPKQTLDIMQSLYERHKILTYPRTDSKYLTDDIYPEIKQRLQNIKFNPYDKYVKIILASKIKNSKRIFDNSKVSDHHAIIPTDIVPNIINLNQNERRIYELVLKRFICVFLDDHKYYEQEVEIECNNNIFCAKGKNIIDNGWRAIYSDNEIEEEKSILLPQYQLNEKIKVTKELKKALTTPPARYTEASILYAMEHPSKFVTEISDKKILEETGGLGTPATRADILEKLFQTGYLELKGRTIYPTSKGIQLINLVPEELKSVLLTASYETRLKKIAQGIDKESLFIKDIENETKKLVNNILTSDNNYKHDNMTNKICPTCGSKLLEVNAKNNKSLVCMNRTCKYRLVISRISNIRCSNCHKFLELIYSQSGDYYKCKCGYKEKSENLHKKIAEKKKEMSKKDINNYLKSQEKEIPNDNPFAKFFK